MKQAALVIEVRVGTEGIRDRDLCLAIAESIRRRSAPTRPGSRAKRSGASERAINLRLPAAARDRVVGLKPDLLSTRGGPRPWHTGCLERPGAPQDRVTGPRTLATIVYTSGSTGAAKGVMLSRDGLLWNGATCLDLVPARSDDLMIPTLKLKRARIIAEHLAADGQGRPRSVVSPAPVLT